MLWIIFMQKMEAYISIAICNILPYAPKEVGVLNGFGKPQNPYILWKAMIRASPEVLHMWSSIVKLDEEKLTNAGLVQEIGFSSA